jgi:hypothetical protein
LTKGRREFIGYNNQQCFAQFSQQRNPLIMKQVSFFTSLAIAAIALSASAADAQVTYTFENASMALSGANIPGWDATSGESRECGPFGGTVAHQAIDSAGDPNQGSGSVVFTFSAGSGSLTQQILLTTQGQTVESYSIDVAHDGGCTALVVGLYEENNWNVLDGGYKEIIAEGVPADTDGTLDSFTTVTIPSFTVPNSAGNNMRVFVGTSATGAYGAATVGAKVAIDNVRLSPASAVADWTLY